MSYLHHIFWPFYCTSLQLNNSIGDGQGFSKILYLKFYYFSSRKFHNNLQVAYCYRNCLQNLLPQPCYFSLDLYCSHFYLLNKKTDALIYWVFSKGMEVYVILVILWGKLCSFKNNMRKYANIWSLYDWGTAHLYYFAPSPVRISQIFQLCGIQEITLALT
jgi:hypothetical protein